MLGNHIPTSIVAKRLYETPQDPALDPRFYIARGPMDQECVQVISGLERLTLSIDAVLETASRHKARG